MAKRRREFERLKEDSTFDPLGATYTNGSLRRSKRLGAGSGQVPAHAPVLYVPPAPPAAATVAPAAAAPAPQQQTTAAPPAQATTVTTQQQLNTVPEDDENDEADEDDEDEDEDEDENEEDNEESSNDEEGVERVSHNSDAELEETASGLEHGSDGDNSHSRRSREPIGHADDNIGEIDAHNDPDEDLDNGGNNQARGQAESTISPSQAMQTAADGMEQRRKEHDDSWEKISRDLKEASADEEFVQRYKDCRDLSSRLQDNDYIVQLPDRTDDMNLATYLPKIQKAVQSTNMAYCEAEWRRAISRIRSEFGDAGARTLERKLSSYKEGVEHGTGQLPDGPSYEDIFHAQWTGRLDQIERGTGIWPVSTPRIFQRCKAAYDRAREILEKRKFTIRPSVAGENETLEQYCDSLFSYIDYALVDSVENSWPAEPRDDAIQARYDRMWLRVKTGGFPYREDEPSPKGLKFKSIAKNLGFDHHRSLQNEGRWQYQGKLGSGSFGQVSVWFCYNNYGVVTDRLAIKESYLVEPKKDYDGWDDDPSKWNGKPENREPMEYAALAMLNLCHDSESIIKCRAYGIYDEKAMVRLYTEYCQHGDLESTIMLYHTMMRLKSDVPLEDDDDVPALRFPDRVLWRIFEALASAICLMYQGFLPGNSRPAPEGFCQMLHRDLKPANIFLAAPRKGNMWPSIPMPKVGDFGIVMWSDDESVQTRGAGTEGYCSPESIRGGVPYEITSQSEVWAIGRIMLSLINLNDANDKDLKADEEDVNHEDWPKMKEGMDDIIDQTLGHLVLECLSPKPDERPRPDDLWETIQRHVEDMRWQASPANEMLVFAGDKYADFAK